MLNFLAYLSTGAVTVCKMLNLIGSHVNFIGLLLTFFGLLDALKYRFESNAIRRVGTAKGHSRKFINCALANDIVRIVYFICFDPDVYLLLSTLMALICMLELWITIYFLYPYKCRKLNGFKRPNILIYLLNSLLPNKIRKRL